MRIDEITNSTEKLELLRMIDAAIWQAMDAESAYGDYDDASDDADNKGQGVAKTPAVNQPVVPPKPVANQVTSPKPAAIQKPIATPVKMLNPQQLAQMIKKFGVKSTATPATSTPIRPNINAAPIQANNNNVPNSHSDTFNMKNEPAKHKADEQDKQA